MTASQADAGLCATCAHVGTCSLTGCKEAGVFQCSEYEPGEGNPVRSDNPGPWAANPGRERLLGLCMDCAGRETCTFPKPEGGVWHCEEYATE